MTFKVPVGSHPLDRVQEPLAAVRAYLLEMAPPTSLLLADSTRFARQVSGKMMRPALTLLIAQVLGLAPSEQLTKIASVSELIHVATLLHDDVIDQADQRRGHPTVGAQYGNRVAILSGDWLLAQASRTLAEVGNLPLVKVFSHVLADLCDGEVEQMRTAFQLQETTWETYRHKTYGKTASLFAAATQAPAHLAGLPASDIERWRHYGECVGMAFQWVDDLLDYTGDAEAMGKPVLDDLKNGLLNAPILYALSGESPLSSQQQARLTTEVAQIFDWVGKPDTTDQVEVACLAIREQLQTAGILDAIATQAEQWVEQALTCLPSSDQCADAQALADLAQLTRYIVLRKT